MIHAYNKNLLSDAQSNLGFAFDYACNKAGISLNDFNDFFITSLLAQDFASGNPKVLCGMSGTELALEIFQKINFKHSYIPYEQFSRSKEYWTGWILAYFQWYTAFSFEQIRQKITAEQICQMYSPLHEAPEQKAVEELNRFFNIEKDQTNLSKLRKKAGLTQKQLSELSGVNLRTLQDYETGRKNINMASGQSINALSKILCCNFYDIMEIK